MVSEGLFSSNFPDPLDQLLRPVNGFIILDLHNLYCQLLNFDIAFDKLLAFYPLDKVREIHISGGSWEASRIEPGRKVRRDTHDNSVPPDVFQLLETVISRCPNLKYVVLEQLGNALATGESRMAFYSDFLQLETIVNRYNSGTAFQAPLPDIFQPPPSGTFAAFAPPGCPVEDKTLYQQQLELSTILETSSSYAEAKQRLDQSTLANSAWQIEGWQPYMLETVINIARKWASPPS